KEAYLISIAKLIIWNKAPMTNKFVFKALNQIFHNIMKINKLFGEKVIVFGSNFCKQTNNINENQKQKEFAKFLLQIGDRTYPIVADTENRITIPSDIVVA
ncbi:2375_t:CDS:2, partial [Dentiscutata erythropus]